MNQFENITPEDFSGRLASLNVANFDGFVEACQFALRNAVVLNNGALPVPMIVGATHQGEAWPIASPGGVVRTTLKHLRDQLAERGGNRYFFAIQAEVGWVHDDDVTTHAELQEAGGTGPGVMFYAAMRDGSTFIRHTGCARFMGYDLGPFRDAPTDAPNDLFDGVLA